MRLLNNMRKMLDPKASSLLDCSIWMHLEDKASSENASKRGNSLVDHELP